MVGKKWLTAVRMSGGEGDHTVVLSTNMKMMAEYFGITARVLKGKMEGGSAWLSLDGSGWMVRFADRVLKVSGRGGKRVAGNGGSGF